MFTHNMTIIAISCSSVNVSIIETSSSPVIVYLCQIYLLVADLQLCQSCRGYLTNYYANHTDYLLTPNCVVLP